MIDPSPNQRRPEPGPAPFWIVSPAVEERQAWHQGSMDDAARSLGISAWIVPLPVTAGGAIDGPLLPWAGDLPAAPLLQLQQPLTPMAEQKLVQQLRAWWHHPQALRLFGRPLLILQGGAHLSHPKFSLKRLRWMTSDMLILSRDRGNVLELMQQGFDGQVQRLICGSFAHPKNYLEQLQIAHHAMEPRGLWLPAVQALTSTSELSWREGSSKAYREWLLLASAWSYLRFLEQQEAPVFIESWQGHQRWWSVGAAQFPLHESGGERATPAAGAAKQRCWGEPQSEHVALMVHGYYLEKLASMLQRLPVGGLQEGLPGLDLYVSTPLEQIDKAETLLRAQGWPRVNLVGVTNRGRDIAPFLLELLPAALRQGHTAFVKVHTKASPHLHEGEEWGQYLVDALLDHQLLRQLPQRLMQDPALGLLAPAGTVLPISLNLKANVLHLRELLQKKAWCGQWALQQDFVAGSMFCGRLQGLRPLLELELSLDSFEPELGQTDGTLAHALERWISLEIRHQRLRFEELPGQAEVVPRFGYGRPTTPRWQPLALEGSNISILSV